MIIIQEEVDTTWVTVEKVNNIQKMAEKIVLHAIDMPDKYRNLRAIDVDSNNLLILLSDHTEEQRHVMTKAVEDGFYSL